MTELVLDDHDHVQWVTAAPLWSPILRSPKPTRNETVRMRRPAILRFASDAFMEELAAVLESEPETLGDYEATKQSYRPSPPGKPIGWAPPLDSLKLYQAAHGHFNLVAAALTCRLPGLPDKAVEAGEGEKVAFVLRRIDGQRELGWVDATEAKTDKGWAAAPPDSVVDGEELHPLFPISFDETEERRRRVLVGLIPVTSNKSFKNSATASLSPTPSTGAAPSDSRLDELDEKVLKPLEALRDNLVQRLAASDPAVKRAMASQSREASRFLLVDLGDILSRFVPVLWRSLLTGVRPAPTSALVGLYDLLDRGVADTDTGVKWRAALVGAWNERDVIWEEAEGEPATSVDLAKSPVKGTTTPLTSAALRSAAATAFASVGKPPPARRPPFQAPKVDPRSSVHYVVRCVYQRPQCGALRPDVLSDRSEEFALAGFFDTDAPARPLHVGLPINISIASLRKSPKNVAFLMSKELRQQMTRAVDMEKLIKKELADGQPIDVGMICSLSIPIITLCAFMLLMIVIGLLNIVFWWMPFFRICFPIANVKGSS